MARILADLPDEDLKWLDEQAASRGESRAALLRAAVAAYRAGESRGRMEAYFGLWTRPSLPEISGPADEKA